MTLRVTVWLDRLSLWLFFRVLGYWRWRTGRPVVMAFVPPAAVDPRASAARFN